jgi:hypothetical protein
LQKKEVKCKQAAAATHHRQLRGGGSSSSRGGGSANTAHHMRNGRRKKSWVGATREFDSGRRIFVSNQLVKLFNQLVRNPKFVQKYDTGSAGWRFCSVVLRRKRAREHVALRPLKKSSVGWQLPVR